MAGMAAGMAAAVRELEKDDDAGDGPPRAGASAAWERARDAWAWWRLPASLRGGAAPDAEWSREQMRGLRRAARARGGPPTEAAAAAAAAALLRAVERAADEAAPLLARVVRGSPAAAAAVRRELARGRPETAAAAATLLRRARPADAAAVLAALPPADAAAWLAAAALPPARAADLLAAADPPAARAAVRALAGAPPPDPRLAAAALGALLAAPAPSADALAADALAALADLAARDPAAAAELERLLDDPAVDAARRRAAAAGAGAALAVVANVAAARPGRRADLCARYSRELRDAAAAAPSSVAARIALAALGSLAADPDAARRLAGDVGPPARWAVSLLAAASVADPDAPDPELAELVLRLLAALADAQPAADVAAAAAENVDPDAHAAHAADSADALRALLPPLARAAAAAPDCAQRARLRLALLWWLAGLSATPHGAAALRAVLLATDDGPAHAPLWELLDRAVAEAPPDPMASSGAEGMGALRVAARLLANVAANDADARLRREPRVARVLDAAVASGDAEARVQAVRAQASIAASSLGPRYAEGVLLLYEPPGGAEPEFDVVFIHGVTGDPLATWRAGPPIDVGEDDPRFVCWPRDWLGPDLARARVLSLGYEIFLSKWFGSALPLTVRSRVVLDKLALAAVGSRPVVFVCHSFGGLLVKQMLSYAEREAPYLRLLRNTRGVVWYSTPHLGVKYTAYTRFDPFSLLFRETPTIEDLKPQSPALLRLNEQFLRTAPHVATLSFGEGITCFGGSSLNCYHVVVDDSADPGYRGPRHVFLKLAADHPQVCKPEDRADVRYLATLRFITALFAAGVSSGSAAAANAAAAAAQVGAAAATAATTAPASAAQTEAPVYEAIV